MKILDTAMTDIVKGIVQDTIPSMLLTEKNILKRLTISSSKT